MKHAETSVCLIVPLQASPQFVKGAEELQLLTNFCKFWNFAFLNKIGILAYIVFVLAFGELAVNVWGDIHHIDFIFMPPKTDILLNSLNFINGFSYDNKTSLGQGITPSYKELLLLSILVKISLISKAKSKKGGGELEWLQLKS